MIIKLIKKGCFSYHSYHSDLEEEVGRGSRERFYFFYLQFITIQTQMKTLHGVKIYRRGPKPSQSNECLL